MSSRIKIAIADDHHLFRKGIIAILNRYPEFEIVCEADNGKTLLELVAVYKPEIVLLDLLMPVLDGIETTIQLRELYPETKIIVLSMLEEDVVVLKMVGLGVSAYLPKNLEPSELVEAINTVHTRGKYFTEMMSNILSKGIVQYQKNEKKLTGTVLTPREVEVVRLMASQFTNQEIGDILHLSARTVEGHRKRIQDKIGAKNMAGIIVYAVKQGLVD